MSDLLARLTTLAEWHRGEAIGGPMRLAFHLDASDLLREAIGALTPANVTVWPPPREEPPPHGPVSERFMQHHYGASGRAQDQANSYVTSAETDHEAHHAVAWDESDDDQKGRALVTASRLLDERFIWEGDRIDDQVQLLCHCGSDMVAVIDGPDEVLYMCARDECPTQVNVSRKQRAAPAALGDDTLREMAVAHSNRYCAVTTERLWQFTIDEMIAFARAVLARQREGR